MRPDIDSIACFVTAARTLNFRAAAKVQSLTPAALGKRIQQLEELFGARLFHRTTRKVELTEAGRSLLPHAQALLAEADACIEAAQGSEGPPPLDLNLGTRYELGMSWVIPVRRIITDEMPWVTMHLYFGAAPDLEQQILGLTIDCAISSRQPSTVRIDSETLHEERYVLCASRQLLSETPFNHPEDANEHVLLDAHEDLPLFRYWNAGRDGKAVLRFEKVVTLGTIAAIRALVLDGEGVAVLPEYFVRDDLKSGDIVSVLPDIELDKDYFRLLFRADDPRRDELEQMAEIMRGFPLQ